MLLARYTVQLAGFTGVWPISDVVDRETVLIEPPDEIVTEAVRWYEREQPEGEPAEMIGRRVLDLVEIEVAV